MRQEILKQKQEIAYKNIQPLTHLVAIKTHTQTEAAVASVGRIEALMRTKSEEEEQNHQIFGRTHREDSCFDTRDRKSNQEAVQKPLRNPSFDKKGSNKSEKLVGKPSIITIDHTQKTAKPFPRLQTSDLEHHRDLYKRDEHIHHLLKVNENLRNMQGKNNAVLLRSIEMLRNNQKCYLPSIEAETEGLRREDSLLLLDTIEPTEQPPEAQGCVAQASRGPNILRALKEEAALRFKEKVKVKQSRKHIYRTLKTKNDNLNKIKLKTHHCTPVRDRDDPEVPEQPELHLLRLHCPQVKHNSNNIRSSNFRSLTKTYYQNMHELRVQTKQNSLQNKPSFELRTTKCQFLATEADSHSSPHKRKTGMKAFEEIALNLKRNNELSSHGLKTQKHQNAKNAFRELTPWHFEDQ